MRRIIAAVIALACALLVQLSIVNGLRLPGGGVPDLVLLGVMAIGMTGGPRAGLVAGFCAGLALDLAPPATELAGQYALVFCLVGYGCGRLRFTLFRSALAAVAAGALAVAAGEALATALTLVLDSPQVTLGAAAHVLAWSVLYDMAVGPVVLFACVRVAMALGASFSLDQDTPATEVGGSAGPSARTEMGRGGPLPGLVPGAARAGTGLVGPVGRWLTGDQADDVPVVGAIGWLDGPVKSRKGRRDQARLAASVTGASPRKGAFWVGSRPPGLVPVQPPDAVRRTGLARLRPRAGTAGSAAAVSLRGLSAGRSGASPGVGSGLPRQALVGQSRAMPGSGLPGQALAGQGIAGGGLPGAAFGSGALARPGRAAGRPLPRIAFGSGGLTGAFRTSPGRPAAPKFRSAGGGGGLAAGGASAGAAGPRPGVRRRFRLGQARGPKFTAAGGRATRRQPRPKTPRLATRRRPMRWLPRLRRSGGRSAVWRIGGRKSGGSR